MSYKKSGKKNVIKHTCNKINKDGKCRFAINLSELQKPSSKSNLYFLICKDQNKGYLVPSGLVKKYSKYFAGSGHKFPLAINPKRNQILYQGNKEDISKYCKLGSDKFKTILNVSNKYFSEKNKKDLSSKKEFNINKYSSTKMNSGEKKFISYFKLKPKDYVYCGHKNKSGRDFEILGAKAKKLGRYIEVKNISNKYKTINLSRAQYECAMQHKNSYFVFLIDKSQSPTQYYLIPIGKISRPPDAYRYTFRVYDYDEYIVNK